MGHRATPKQVPKPEMVMSWARFAGFVYDLEDFCQESSGGTRGWSGSLDARIPPGG